MIRKLVLSAALGCFEPDGLIPHRLWVCSMEGPNGPSDQSEGTSSAVHLQKHVCSALGAKEPSITGLKGSEVTVWFTLQLSGVIGPPLLLLK